MKYCTVSEIEEFRTLRDITRRNRRSDIKDQSEQMARSGYEGEREEKKEEAVYEEWEKEIEEKKKEYREDLRRYDEEIAYKVIDEIQKGGEEEDLKEWLRSDKKRKEKEERLKSLIWSEGMVDQERDRAVKRALREYKGKGYISIERGMLKITAKGARILARGILREIMKRRGGRRGDILRRNYGSKMSSFLRDYEPGDDYELISLEATLLNALKRSNSLELKNEDFRVHKTEQKKNILVGLIIDKSGSMRYNGKINAAIETSLALSEFVNLHSDELKIFAFGEETEEIAPWEMLNMGVGGNTDIKDGLRAFRKISSPEDTQKHAYCLTDTEPNMEEGVYVGFKKAARGVLKEAQQYKRENIALNIIMFDDEPYLVELGRRVAKSSDGRFFLTAPENLADFVIEDYMRMKERLS